MSTADLILEFLRQGGYVSGQKISDELKISRNGVSKNIKSLRSLGYEIESVTNKGYLLVNEPDKMSEAEINGSLKTVYIGCPTEIIESVDSTNEEIKRRAKGGAQQGLTIVSDEQTHGRGRIGRAWTSPKGSSVYESILLKPEISPAQAPCITLAAGLAVCRAINEIAEVEARIKWPNDVIIGRKKLCGILTEMMIEDNAAAFAVVGVGINVNNSSFPGDTGKKATSLRIEKGRVFSRNQIIIKLAECFEDVYNEFIMSGFDALKEEYIKSCATIGRTVSTQRQGIEISGTAVDIADDGGLVVETADGEKIKVSTGEVTVQGIY